LGDRCDRRCPFEPRWFEVEVLASDVSELNAGLGKPFERGLVDDVGVGRSGAVGSEEGFDLDKLLKDFIVRRRLARRSVWEDCVDFRRSNEDSNCEPARVTAQDQADGAVWMQAYPIKALYSDHGLRKGAMYYEEVAGVGATRGRVRVEQDAVDNLEEARPRDVGRV